MEPESICEDHENGKNLVNLTPVAPEQSGKGLPYAPENWPNPGDIWSWRTGKRVAPNGNYRDRYLYPPPSLFGSGSRRPSFRSKLSVQNFIKETYPHLNVKDFLDSFSWTIPSGNTSATDDVSLKQFELPEESESDFLSESGGCKAGNLICKSLILDEDESLLVMPCDICCAEPEFCRDCCCILCCKTVDSKYGGYSFIKCQAKVGDNICGHAGHIECAIRCYIAGTVGGSIRLDAEYCCRRCDGRTDLIPHAQKLLLTCQYIDSKDDGMKQKILNLCLCFLGGSQKATAKELISKIQLAMSKLNRGMNTKDIVKFDDNLTAHSGLSNSSNAVMDVTNNAETEIPLDHHLDVSKGTESGGYQSEILKLEAEVDQVLEDLRESQEYEYIVAEERLNAHKKYMQNLHLQVEYEKAKLAKSQSDILFQTVRKRKKQLRRAVLKFEEMKKVANGFGSLSKDIIEKHFGL